MIQITGLDLSVLYGTDAQAAAGGNVGGNPVAALTRAEKDSAKAIAAQAKTPAVQRDLAIFRAAVAKAKTPKTLLADPAVQKVLLTVNGLADQVGYPALATKALLSDPKDPKSVAARLPNANWKAAAATYQFAVKGLDVIRSAGVQDTIANAYAEISWRQSLDATTPGLSDALTFRDRAASIKSADDILGDATLRRVVTTTLGIPRQLAIQPLSSQEAAISSRLDIKQLKDKKFVESFVKRYLVAAASSSDQALPSRAQLITQAFGLLL